MSELSPHDYIALYQSKMYEESPDSLRTGDVIRLDLADFVKIARYESMLSLFKHYEENPDYKAKLWVVLNKPCDMVHNPTDGRYFDKNLFLAPMQPLLVSLKKRVLGNILILSDVKPPLKVFVETYRSHLVTKTRTSVTRNEGENPGDYQKRINSDFVDPIMASIEEALSGDIDANHPNDILEALKESSKENKDIQADLNEFEASQLWKKAVEKWTTQQTEAQQKNEKIILKADSAKGKLADLALNQLDSLGLFFYEPTTHFSTPGNDLSYLIQLEDMVTLKVKKEMQESGDLHELLKSKRIVSLKRNFSDRLLNIMGNYFSKIGTPDVMSDKILLLYKHIYPNDFFTDENSYESYRKKSPEQKAEPKPHSDENPTP